MAETQLAKEAGRSGAVGVPAAPDAYAVGLAAYRESFR